MTSLIIGVGVVLVLTILYMIFRVGNLLGLMEDQRGQADKVKGNTVHAYLFIIFTVVGMGLFFWYSYAHFDSYNLPVASEHGVAMDQLFWITMAVTLVAFVPISIVMFWFTFKYRYQKGRKASYYPDSQTLEILWTVIPAIVLSLLIFRGLNLWSDITAPASEEAEVIELVGQQFAWTARYPGIVDKQLGKVNFKLIDAVNEFGLDLTDKYAYDDFKSLELHLPKGKEVLLKIRAKDVLHSVFIPYFRVKMDAVPGMVTSFKFKPTKTTAEMRQETGNENFNYEMACAELCGRGHFSMRFLVVVDEPEEYEKWKTEQASWLKQNPEYMAKIPSELHKLAAQKAGLPIEYNREAQMTEKLGSH